MRFSQIGKIIGAAGVTFLIGFNSQAQGFYAKAGAGFNFGIGSRNGEKTTIARTQNPQDFTVQTIEQAEWVKVNFGKGLTGNGAVGYMFNEQLGAELELSYLAGGKNETYFENTNQYSSLGTDSTILAAKSYARMLMLQPSLIISTDLSEKLDLYGKFGIVISRGHIMSSSALSGDQDVETEGRYEDGWGFGFQAALGLTCALGEQYALFSEVRMSNLSYTPTNFHLLKKTDSGEDITATLPQDTPLEDDYTNVNGQRNVGLKASYPFSHVGISIGLRYNF